jgi:RNA polymerase sigma-70 factor, ECF subfamily
MSRPPETATPAPRDPLHAGLLAQRDDATVALHALLLRAARFEIGRRAAELAHVRGEDREDLALQAADDAFVAVLRKLPEFRGESRFSTWAYKFALYEAAVRVRRRAWQHREVVLDAEQWLTVGDRAAADPQAAYDRAELLAAIRTLIDERLTVRQREVLVALAIQGVPIDVLAERLGTTRGALYKTLHDARRKLRAALTAAGHDIEAIT